MGQGEETGIEIKWLPGFCFMEQRRERKNEESGTIRVKKVLFADDRTSNVRRDGKKTKETTKRIMELFEKTNDAKEENITFGSLEADETRFLGVLLGEAVDRRRTRRAMGAWFQVKKRLRNTRFTKKTQARKVP